MTYHLGILRKLKTECGYRLVPSLGKGVEKLTKSAIKLSMKACT